MFFSFFHESDTGYNWTLISLCGFLKFPVLQINHWNSSRICFSNLPTARTWARQILRVLLELASVWSMFPLVLGAPNPLYICFCVLSPRTWRLALLTQQIVVLSWKSPEYKWVVCFNLQTEPPGLVFRPVWIVSFSIYLRSVELSDCLSVPCIWAILFCLTLDF